MSQNQPGADKLQLDLANIDPALIKEAVERAQKDMKPNRAQRRKFGASTDRAVMLRGQVDWPDGTVTDEWFPSRRAVKRISGARRSTR